MSFTIGLDIGHSTIRAVEIEQRKGRWHIGRVAEVSRCDQRGERQPLRISLAGIEAKMTFNRPVIVAVNDHELLVRNFSVTPMSEDRIERILRLELRQQVGDDKELAADATPVRALPGEDLNYLCAFAQAPEMHELMADLKSVGIEPAAIHAGQIALGNVLNLTEPTGAEEYGLVVDIGAKRTTVVLERGGAFLASRRSDAGGELITEALAKTWKTDFQTAENAKREGRVILAETVPQTKPGTSGIRRVGADTNYVATGVGFLQSAENAPVPATDPFAEVDAKESTPAPETDPQSKTGRSGEDLVFHDDSSRSGPAASPDQKAGPSDATRTLWSGEGEDTVSIAKTEEPAAGTPEHSPGQSIVELNPDLIRAYEQILTRINGALAWYRSQYKLGRIAVTRIRLAGAGGEIAGFSQYLQRRLKVEVQTLALPAVEHPQPPHVHRYATAIGLAMSLSSGSMALDLRPESILKRQAIQTHVVWPIASAACLVLAAGLVAWTLWNKSGFSAERIRALKANAQETKKGEEELSRLMQEYNGYQKDYQAIVSRLSGGADALLAIRILKETMPKEMWMTEMRTEGLSTERVMTGIIEKSNSFETGGRSGKGRGGTTPTPPKPTPAPNTVKDTLLDRGRIYVAVAMKNETAALRNEKEGPAFYHDVFRRWIDSVLSKNAPDSERPFFIQNELGPREVNLGEDPPFRTNVRFVIEPARLNFRAAVEGR